MWHEARRQERKIRGMLVDYRKRAERRRDFYEKIVGGYNINMHKNAQHKVLLFPIYFLYAVL